MSGEPAVTTTARAEVSQLVASLPEGAVRTVGDDVAFDAAWEIRAFALAVAAHRQGTYEWQEFQDALVTSIARSESAEEGRSMSYYDHWVEALEVVLAGAGVVDAGDLDDRTRTVLATPRDLEHQRAKRDPVCVDPARPG